MSGALDGIRVIDFGQYLPGPLVAMMLADEGAEVIRIDPPGGPRWQHPCNAVLQRGKQSIVLDLKQPDDRETAQRLVRTADVVIENFRPGVMARLGLGQAAMLAANPALVYCSIPGFGADDPRAGLQGWEGIVGAASGCYTPGHRNPTGAEAVFNALTIASNYAAFVAANSILAALVGRERSGSGQWIEIPLFDAMFEAIGGSVQQLPTPRQQTLHGASDGDFLCSDGRWVHQNLNADRHLTWFAERFLPKEWADEGLFDTPTLRKRPDLARELQRRVGEMYATKSSAEWDRLVNENGTPMAVVRTTHGWLHEDEQARAIEAVISLDDPEYGPSEQAGYPVRLSKTPPQAQGPRHALDADRKQILSGLAMAAERRAPNGSGNALRHSLEGIRVVDLTQVLAGPTAGRILAEYGADVIKINPPRAWNIGHVYCNSGKRTMLLDLKQPEGLELLWRLVEHANIFTQNFAKGVADRLGIGEADVRRHQPDVVYGSVSAYTYDGPRGGYRGWEPIGQTPTGMMLRWGGGEPLFARFALCDYGTGHLFAFALLLGLFHQVRTGEGQHVQSSLVQAGTYHQIPYMIDFEGHVWDEPAGQSVKGWGPLDRLYRGSDRWFYLVVPDGKAASLANVEGLAGVEALSGDALVDALTARFAGATAATWVQRLTAAGIAAHVLRQIEENMQDEVVQRRGLSIVREHPGIGSVRLVGPGRRLQGTPVELTSPAPLPGWHTREIVAEAGMADRFDELAANGVVADRLPDTVTVAL